MRRKNKFLAAVLAVILVLPVFSFSTAATLTGDQITVSNAVFIDYFREVVWVIPAGTEQTQALAHTVNGTCIVRNYGPGIGASDAVAGLARDAAHDNNGAALAPQFMFTLRAVPNAQTNALNDPQAAQRDRDRALNSLARERWMPVYGGGVNITRAIPTNVRRNFYIAVRLADDRFTTNRGFESRVAFQLMPRFNQRDFRGALQYDPGIATSQPGGEVVRLTSTTMTNGIIYNFDLFSPVHAPIPAPNEMAVIPAPSNRFILGTQVNVSSAPQLNATNDGVAWARSRNVRFRIPRRTAMPNVVFNAGTERITGMRNHFQFAVDVQDITGGGANGGGTWNYNTPNPNPTWHPFSTTGGTTTATIQLDNNFASLSSRFMAGTTTLLTGDRSAFNENNVEVFRIWVRVAPMTDMSRPSRNAPASEPRLVEIPRSQFNVGLTP